MTRLALTAVIGEVRMASGDGLGQAARPSPGMLDRHYAPRATLRVAVDSTDDALEAAVNIGSADGQRTVVLVRILVVV